MQDNAKILIGDNSVEFGEKFKASLDQSGHVVTIMPKNGRDLINAIVEQQPNLVIMESIMPEVDGIGVLQEVISKSKNAPKFIVVGENEGTFVQNEVMALGASYFMIKPIDMSILCSRVESIISFEQINIYKDSGNQIIGDESLESIVTNVILMLGVPAHVKGYHYIRQSIIMSINDTRMVNSITKLLYPTVAKIFDTTASRVERAIRHAIEIAWDRGDVDTLNSYFGYTINVGRGKPTNSEFIAMVSDKLRIQLKKSGAILN